MTVQQTPPPNDTQIFYCGDCVTFTLTVPKGLKGQGWLRTNLGHADVYRRELIEYTEKGSPILSWDWHDLLMVEVDTNVYQIKLPLTQVGIFEAKCFFCSEDNNHLMLWPDGGNTRIKVEPASSYNCNTMYTAFVRQFGPNKGKENAAAPNVMESTLSQQGYTVIPPSGKFRDLIKELDFIINELCCNILQLLPIHPAPTTYARMGRYGSPFAAIDFFDVDPIYADFDPKATPLDQFVELVNAVHARRAHIFIDIPVNHTGWASKEQTLHPEYFVRDQGRFVSPGAWGVVWADLCKLNYNNPEVHHLMADVFLFWCRHGVDGFRCDAGYMLPLHAWRYITAKVREEFPDTIFMLEGLGGPIDVMNELLLKGNLNWAYSELFQNYSRQELESYLPNAFNTSLKKGTLINFAETHDNSRLAARSPTWAKMRTALCALSSHTGAFGFANGVEWLAKEQIDVHERKGLNWGAKENLVGWLRRLQTILAIHEAFLPNTKLSLIQHGSQNVVAILRQHLGKELLVLCNLDENNGNRVSWAQSDFLTDKSICFDLLTSKECLLKVEGNDYYYDLNPGEVMCLTNYIGDVQKLDGALNQKSKKSPINQAREQQKIKGMIWEIWDFFNEFGDVNGIEIDLFVDQFRLDPIAVIASLAGKTLAPIMYWNFEEDETREVMLPPKYLLFIQHSKPFTFSVKCPGGTVCEHRQSIQINEDRYMTLVTLKKKDVVKPTCYFCEAVVYENGKEQYHNGQILVLPEVKDDVCIQLSADAEEVKQKNLYAILSNSLGGMAQVRGAWGEVYSKYDALLAANIDPRVPVDRQVVFSFCKVWCVYHGFSQEVNIDCLTRFMVHPDNQVLWSFEVPCGQGKRILLDIILTMNQDHDHVQLVFIRRKPVETSDIYVSEDTPVQLIIRPFIEDRCCHSVTKAYMGAEHTYVEAVKEDEHGFDFSPSHRHRLKMLMSQGVFHKEPQWQYMLYYRDDHQRGLEFNGDVFSPGYFDLKVYEGDLHYLHTSVNLLESHMSNITCDVLTPQLPLSICLKEGLKRFMVKRDDAKTIIAGYPWFLDWGRDSLICMRGFLAAGYVEEVREAIITYARAELNGTLPNMIRGDDYSNRDTSDAPLWFAVILDEYIKVVGNADILKLECSSGRTILDVLESIVFNYQKGTSNGIFMDVGSGLIYSPSHFTWMDTNYPAATPRQGYPIEIQALWWRTLSILAHFKPNNAIQKLADQVKTSIQKYFIVKSQDFLVDCLHAPNQEPAANATPDDACRCNQLLAITLGGITDKKLQQQILLATARLVIPGSIRSLAKLPVKYALPVSYNGHLLNNPYMPYWGNYAGDEDTRRKPAYHNGTGWGWVFPHYVEAFYLCDPEGNRETSLAILASIKLLLEHDCLGQLPENSDGDYPHRQRGCGAQAWSMTEAYRVLTRLKAKEEDL